jgi:hypothetical protein
MGAPSLLLENCSTNAHILTPNFCTSLLDITILAGSGEATSFYPFPAYRGLYPNCDFFVII